MVTMMEGVVPVDYEGLCQDWSDGEVSIDSWRELLRALGGRVGWWFLDPRVYEDYDGGPMWCFGPGGESELGLMPLGHGFVVYMADSEEEVTLDAIGEVVAWLDEYEHEHAGFSPVLNQYLEGGQGRQSRRPAK